MAWQKKCKLPLTVGWKVYQSSLSNFYIHPCDETMLQKAPRAACQHIWSCPLPSPAPGPSRWLFAHSPTRQTHTPTPKYHSFFVRSISWWFPKFSQLSRRLETLSPVKGKHHDCPSQAAATSAPVPLCKPAPGLHLYYYIQLALLQPRGQGAWATPFILSQNWVSASKLLSTAQAAPVYHLKNCQIAQATAVLGTCTETTCTETTCTNAGQALKPTFTSVVFPSMNAVLAARTRPAVKGSLSQSADLRIPAQSCKGLQCQTRSDGMLDYAFLAEKFSGTSRKQK